MYTMSMNTMNTSADAWCAPACQRSAHMMNTLILDTAVEAVSLLILALVVLVSLLVRIILPEGQSRTYNLPQSR